VKSSARRSGRDLKLLQGTWSITGLEIEGEKTPDSMLADARIVIKGSRFTSTGMGTLYEGTLKLDSSTQPAQLDLKFDAGPPTGETNLGIYKLDGDTWTLCLATRGSVRPSRFASTPGSGFALETLTRGIRPSVATPPISMKKRAVKDRAYRKKAKATEFEGEWQMVSGVMDGKAMEESLTQWVRRRTVGNETAVVAGPQTMMRMTFTYDASKSPKTIDYVNLHGPNKGAIQLGIYEFEGNLLRVCIAAPGAARPVQFQSLRGDGITFTVWKRL